MPKSRKPQKILLRAADILDETGWCRGKYTNAKGAHCAVGAIMQAVYESLPKKVQATIPPADPNRGLGAFALPETDLVLQCSNQVEEILHGSMALADWNDVKSRRKEQVQSVLREAAARASEGR